MKDKMQNVFIAILLLLIPTIGSAQAPGLGTASRFVLFTSVGAFENTGTSSATGDIGTGAGLFSGFPPGTVTGEIHVADAVTAQAAIDVDIAYSHLQGLPCDSVIGNLLGDDQLLAPGTYCLVNAATLNGNLFLDGQGNPNALFIFKIDGALSAGISSNIILINSAAEQNVYWQVNGQFILNDNSVFRGTIITNGSITLLENSFLYGRGLSRGGAILLQNNFSFLTQPVLLVIKLAGIDASNKGSRNLISWVTKTESKDDVFEVEKSSDKIHFATISILKAAGQPGSYNYWDEYPFNGMNHYRLKMQDASGSFAYSRIVTAFMKAAIVLEVYPNPATGMVTVIINGKKGNNRVIRISDITGKEVRCVVVPDNKVNLGMADLLPGIYFIAYSDEINRQVIKIIKQ
jgi:hypothetical protein